MFRKIIHRNFMNVRFSSTVDNIEIQQFQKFSAEWWNEFGPVKALHSMNKLRLPMIQEGLVNSGKLTEEQLSKPETLQGMSILDVGCGGGILCEPLARLGGDITGLDANPMIIEHATEHAKMSSLCINYITDSIESHASNNVDKYDAVIASEVVEHVTNKKEFLAACLKCLKPNGSIFITTISKTFLANFAGVFLAENVLNLVPSGTHDYEKFIEPHKLESILLDHNCRTVLIHGMVYNFLTNQWHWCSDRSLNYGLHSIKL